MLQACKYGAACTRKNPAHFKEFSHPAAIVLDSPGDHAPHKRHRDDDDDDDDVDYHSSATKKNVCFLEGKTICFSGGLAGMVRRVCAEKASALGAIVVDSVTKKLDILFVGLNILITMINIMETIGASPGSKLDKAKDLGVRVMSESDFTAILDGTFSDGNFSTGNVLTN